MNFPNREELSFRKVLALPKASRQGWASRFVFEVYRAYGIYFAGSINIKISPFRVSYGAHGTFALGFLISGLMSQALGGRLVRGCGQVDGVRAQQNKEQQHPNPEPANPETLNPETPKPLNP